MEGVLLALFFVFLFGSVMLILFFGYQNSEEEKRQKSDDEVGKYLNHLRVPRFFESPVLQPHPDVEAAREALLRRVQEHVDAEQRVVEEFVSQPSIDSLYRTAPRRAPIN